MRLQDDDTICAEITPYGKGAVSVLRVSGKNSWTMVQKIAPFLPHQPTPRKAYVGFLKHKKKKIDEVILLCFDQNQSFTSEKVVEISCHGSPIICEEILNILQEQGCRMADRGEFTYRAFLSGRIDLTQAESVMTLIESQSQRAKSQALLYLQGGLSQRLKEIKKQVSHIQANVEAEIDFLEEDITVLSAQENFQQIVQIKEEFQKLIQSYESGVCIREGLRVGIFGRPNTGKSTLLNQLLKEDKAIVSEKEGTTRDQVDGQFFMQGQMFRVMDTAGIRVPEDEIEKKGLEKTLQCFEKSNLKIFVLDGTKILEKENFQKASQIFLDLNKKINEHKNNTDFVFVVNKIDLKPKKEILSLLKKSPYNKFNEKTFFISARTGEGIEELKKFFLEQVHGEVDALHLPRHLFHLKQADSSLQKLEQFFKEKNPQLELISIELRVVLKNIQNLLGEEVNPDILDQIFSQFCIGK